MTFLAHRLGITGLCYPEKMVETQHNSVTSGVCRFRMQNKFNLRSVLPAMGISDAFNPTAADFTGISGQLINSFRIRNINFSSSAWFAAFFFSLLQWRMVFMYLMLSMK